MNRTGDQAPGPQRWGSASGQVVVGDIPHEPPVYQPRAGLLRELDRSRAQVPVVLAVTGMPGVGKTVLAAAYARAKLAAGWRLVAWVSAGNTGSLLAGLARVADAAGLRESDGGRYGPDAGRLVRQQLEADGDRCLLVFDGASDPDLLQPFVPGYGAARVVITGAERSVAIQAASVPVGVFSDDEALAFLTARTGRVDPEGAAALAAEVGRLPLALAQAAAVIAVRSLGYRAYLELLRAVRAEQALIGEAWPPSLPGTAGVVLQALEAIRSDDKTGASTRVLEIMAVLSEAGVRRDLLHAAGQEGALAAEGHQMSAAQVDEALARLAERSLVSVSLDGQDIIAHPLVMLAIRAQTAHRQRLTAVCRATASLLAGRTRALEVPGDRPAVTRTLEQVSALLDTTAGPVGEADEELTRALLRLRFLVLYHLIELGDSTAQAVRVGEPLIADLERVLGPDHPDTLNARNSLAAAYQAAGRAAEGIALFERILVSRQRLLGPDHPDTMTSQSNLAAAYQNAGRAAEAVLLSELTAANRERLLGADHPSTLTSHGNLAAAYWAAGRPAEAITLFEQTLAAQRRVLGPDHSATLRTQNYLAAVYLDVGQAAEDIPRSAPQDQ